MLHGCDYNCDQWLNDPDILEEDIRLMKLAGINNVTIGVFSWVKYEPEEGKFDFEWLDYMIETLTRNQITITLSTPSAAHPAWLDLSYPEVLNMNEAGIRRHHGNRAYHCYTSPILREKVYNLNLMLAQRYQTQAGIVLWHISNEYGRECHCPLCQAAFREWLKKKYKNDINILNHEWWTSFWGHSFKDFSQIESPSSNGETSTHGLILDWKRFVSDQIIDFMVNEINPIRRITPNIPITTNFMAFYETIDYWKMAKELDIVSWDSYPRWGRNEVDNINEAIKTAFLHDLHRSFKKASFLLMESTPSQVNWMDINQLKRPGMHYLSSMQAVAHGSDSVQYFQWRKSRGGIEKFHGAVIDHYGHENTRVFTDVKKVGQDLNNLSKVDGSFVKSSVAILFDWENLWATKYMSGFIKEKKYIETCISHYQTLWGKDIPVDIVSLDSDFSDYRLLIVPMLYMLKSDTSKKLKDFVNTGGILIGTCMTGYVNENDLCFLGGFPGDGLKELFGIWNEEMDALYPGEKNPVIFKNFDMDEELYAHSMCEIVHPNSNTDVLAVYGQDFYKNMPVLTKCNYGLGSAYYLAAQVSDKVLGHIYEIIDQDIIIDTPRKKGFIYGDGISIRVRENALEEYYFIMNFTEKDQLIQLPSQTIFTDELLGVEIKNRITLPTNGVKILNHIKNRSTFCI